MGGYKDRNINGLSFFLSLLARSYLSITPDDWEHANVTAICKKGARHDAANYRPVSLTSLCCKLLEHVIVSNMVKDLEKHDILNDCQHGFRAT